MASVTQTPLLLLLRLLLRENDEDEIKCRVSVRLASDIVEHDKQVWLHS